MITHRAADRLKGMLYASHRKPDVGHKFLLPPWLGVLRVAFQQNRQIGISQCEVAGKRERQEMNKWLLICSSHRFTGREKKVHLNLINP